MTGRPARDSFRDDPSTDLVEDRAVGDLLVAGQQEGLADDLRQARVVLEREQDARARLAAARGDDAEVLVVRLHQHVPRAEVDLVAAELAPYAQVAVVDLQPGRALDLRDQLPEHLAS